MNTQRVQQPILGIGTFSVVVPLVWVIAAFAGLVLIANWPELFAEPARTQAGALSSAPASVVVQASAESSPPAPGTVPSAAPTKQAGR